MHRRSTRRNFVFAFAAACGLVAAGCLSPTLPLPPPENPSISKIDADGYVTLTGGEGSAQSGALVYAYNRATNDGDFQAATINGAYQLRVLARVGDQIAVWQAEGQETSTSIYVKVRELALRGPHKRDWPPEGRPIDVTKANRRG